MLNYATCFVLAVAAALPVAAAEPVRPNILFIIVDDISRDEVGFLHGKVPTPTLDALSTAGLYFDHAYAASSVCSPSRYTCLTGEYASRSTTSNFKNEISPEGMTQVRWNMGIADGQPTLPSVLRDAGYATGFVGKWHVNGIGRTPYLKAGSDPTDPAVMAHLAADQVHYRERLKTFGFDFADRIYPGNPQQDKNLVAVGLSRHHPEWVNAGGLDFIEQNKDRPFYLYFSLTMPHYPDCAESMRTDPLMTPVGPVAERITGGMKPREQLVSELEAAGIPPRLWGGPWIDESVKALLDKLDAVGIADNTLVIFFNDHGMEHESKGTNYEGGIVTPTMFRWPGRIAGGTTSLQIQNTDFVPTVLDYAGVAAPEGMHLDGYSLRPMLDGVEGSREPVRDAVYSEIGLTRAVTTADGWKYLAFRVPPSLQRTLDERMEDQAHALREILAKYPWTREAGWDCDPQARYFHLGGDPGGSFLERLTARAQPPYWAGYFDPDQLFDLNADPGEGTNLADDPAHAAKLKEMKALLSAHLATMPGTFAELKEQE